MRRDPIFLYRMALHRTWIELDERALAGNIATLRRLSPEARFCAVIKANAYGPRGKNRKRIFCWSFMN